MNSANRWIYIGGVAILAALAVGGYFWGRGDSDDNLAVEDAGEDAGDVDVPLVDGAPEIDGADGTEESGDLLESTGNTDAAPIPEGSEACRSYCQRLVDSGELAEGTTLEGCITQLCSESESEAPAEDEEETQPIASGDELPETSDDCREQCQIFERRGELRAGTTVEDCYSSMCSSDEEAAPEE